MIKAIIFDLDGTLLDTLDNLYESTNFALSNLGFPTRSKDEVKNFIGNGVRKLIERAVPENSNATDKCLEIFKKHYSENMYSLTKPYNNILKILKELKCRNIKIAVLSNKYDFAVKELTEKYFGNFVDISIGQTENIKPKPSVEGVLKIIKEFNIEKNEIIMVGDSNIDIQTAKNAKIKSIAVNWGYGDNLKDADFTVDNPEKIIEIVDNLKSKF